MPEYLRSLVAVLLVSGTVFFFARHQFAAALPARGFETLRNLWLLLSIAAFAPGNFWVFVGCSALLLLATGRRHESPAVLFLPLLLCLPPYTVQIPGLGLVNYFFTLSYPRLLSLTLLCPAVMLLRRRTTHSPGASWTDKMVFFYVALCMLVSARTANVTSLLRDSFLLLVDIAVPYYVVSRGLRSAEHFRTMLAGFVLSAFVVAALACVEAAKHWILYQGLARSWGAGEGVNVYLGRAGLLRVRVTAGHAIALGTVFMVASLFYLHVRHLLRSKRARTLGWALLAAGLTVPVSRGPWVGFALAFFVYLWAGPGALRATVLSIAAFVGGLGAAAVLPGGRVVMDLLPFIGNAEKGSVTYRQQLIENAFILLKQNPWLGVPEFDKQLAKMGMVQGEGIVDVVNTYVQVSLHSGAVGLIFFCGIFLGVLVAIRRVLRKLAREDTEEARELLSIGQVLLASLVGMLVTIATVSSIGVIPWLYWCLAGAGVAYVRTALAFVANGAATGAAESVLELELGRISGCDDREFAAPRHLGRARPAHL